MEKKENSRFWLIIVFLPAFIFGAPYLGGIIWDIYKNKQLTRSAYQKVEKELLFKQFVQVFVLCFLLQLIGPLALFFFEKTEMIPEDYITSGLTFLGLFLGAFLFQKGLREKHIYITSAKFWELQNLKNELLKPVKPSSSESMQKSMPTKAISADESLEKGRPAPKFSTTQNKTLCFKENKNRGWIIFLLILISIIIFVMTNSDLLHHWGAKTIPAVSTPPSE